MRSLWLWRRGTNFGHSPVTPDSAGKATFALHFPTAVAIGDYVTALGTNFRAGEYIRIFTLPLCWRNPDQ